LRAVGRREPERPPRVLLRPPPRRRAEHHAAPVGGDPRLVGQQGVDELVGGRHSAPPRGRFANLLWCRSVQRCTFAPLRTHQEGVQHMQKRIAAVIAVAATATVVVAAQASQSAPPTKTPGTLTVAFGDPAIGFASGQVHGTTISNPKGYEVDLASAI